MTLQHSRVRSEIAREAARIMCEESITDWRLAKHKAVERLGLPPKSALPENSEVQQALIDYQRLFGGAEYVGQLRLLRQTAVQALRLLAEFSPRLVGGAVSGAVTQAHRVQLHGFADMAESLDIFLHDHGIAFTQEERAYRFPDGREERVPMCSFEAGAVGVDVAMFGEGEQRRVPINPADGQPFRRLDLAAAQRLAEEPAPGL